MSFEFDSQTLKDIEIFKTVKSSKSVFDLFNFTRSLGGKNKLYDFLNSPLDNFDDIRQRVDAIAFFKNSKITVDIDKNSLDFIEHYLTLGNYPTQPPSRFTAIEKGFLNKLSPNNDYYIIERGVDYTLDLINSLYKLSLDLQEKGCPDLIEKNNEKISKLFSQDEYAAISEIKSLEKISAYKTAQYDYLFRYTHKAQINFLLDLMYEYDVFMSLSKAAEKYSLSFPEVSPEKNMIRIEGLFHPFLKDPVKNNIDFNPDKNLLFVSGPNMAGKSTFLKSLGIAVFLAHAGFPVPAKGMCFSLFSGLYTTINLSDSLNSGYSHFYSEVLRIKYIAERLKVNNLLVIFDELFRGTNVKDAYDGSLAVISAFSEVRNSCFAISTHIIEVTSQLVDISNIQFKYLEIIKQNGFPEYTYKLKDGISEDRLGTYILEQERLIEVIKEINN